MLTRATKIGDCCFIDPNVMIAPETIIDYPCCVAAESCVEGAFPVFSHIAGNPARMSKTVEIQCERFRICADQGKAGLEDSP